jgi:hypothetical protein
MNCAFCGGHCEHQHDIGGQPTCCPCNVVALVGGRQVTHRAGMLSTGPTITRRELLLSAKRAIVNL